MAILVPNTVGLVKYHSKKRIKTKNSKRAVVSSMIKAITDFANTQHALNKGHIKAVILFIPDTYILVWVT